MQILDPSKLREDELKVEYLPLLAAGFGAGIVPTEDDSYYMIGQSGFLQTTYVAIQQEDIGDIATQTTSSATIGTLAIRSEASMVAISGTFERVDKGIWEDDYSEQHPLGITVESEKEEYSKMRLYQDLYRIYRECSESDWDSSGATPISERVFLEATKLLGLLPSDLPLPDATPEPTGEIAFEWYKAKKHVFVISVGAKRTISYAGLFGRYSRTYGTEHFLDELPQTVVDNVLRLFS